VIRLKFWTMFTWSRTSAGKLSVMEFDVPGIANLTLELNPGSIGISSPKSDVESSGTFFVNSRDFWMSDVELFSWIEISFVFLTGVEEPFGGSAFELVVGSWSTWIELEGDEMRFFKNFTSYSYHVAILDWKKFYFTYYILEQRWGLIWNT